MSGHIERLQDYFDLPEGSIANGCIAVIQFIDSEGEMRYDYVYDTTNLPLSSSVGLLELVKRDLIQRSLEDEA